MRVQPHVDRRTAPYIGLVGLQTMSYVNGSGSVVQMVVIEHIPKAGIRPSLLNRCGISIHRFLCSFCVIGFWAHLCLLSRV